MKQATMRNLITLKHAAHSSSHLLVLKNCTSEFTAILKCLYEESIISSFNYLYDKNDQIKKTQVVIRFNNIELTRFFGRLVFKSINTDKMFIKYLDLSQIQNFQDIILVSTNRGLNTGEECLKYKIGGRLILVC